MAKLFGFNFPFFKGRTVMGSTSTVLPRQEDFRLVRNDYTQGLLTIKGERWFRPTFGGDIPRLLFDQNDFNSRQKVEDNIRQYTSRFHPQIKVTNVLISQSTSTPEMMDVQIFGYTDLDSSNKDQLLAKFMLPAAG